MNRDWAMKYLDLMMKEDYESGFEIKAMHFPKSFYKYRQLNERTIENIVENKIWVADINALNDPFECSLQFDNDECLRLFFADENFKKTFKDKFGKELLRNEIDEIIKSKEPYLTYTKICYNKNIILHITPDKQLESVQKQWEGL